MYGAAWHDVCMPLHSSTCDTAAAAACKLCTSDSRVYTCVIPALTRAVIKLYKNGPPSVRISTEVRMMAGLQAGLFSEGNNEHAY